LIEKTNLFSFKREIHAEQLDQSPKQIDGSLCVRKIDIVWKDAPGTLHVLYKVLTYALYAPPPSAPNGLLALPAPFPRDDGVIKRAATTRLQVPGLRRTIFRRDLLASDLAGRLVRPAMKRAPEIGSVAKSQRQSDFLVRELRRA
jgi:hypothetical protein